MTLPTRTIGPFTVSAVGLGCMNLSHAYGVPPSEEDGVRLLNHALDAGVTLLDTAALYGGGNNERLLGKAVMHRRAAFTLSSKCVLDLYDGKRGLDGRPEAIAKTLDQALARLGTEHIDLYYMHRLDKDVPVEESVGALVRAKEAGKIGAIGLSEMSAATIRRAHGVHPIAAVQAEYSPCVRNPEIAVLETCRELGIGFVAFSPVARGMLAAAITSDDYVEGDIRLGMPRFVAPNLAHNLTLAARFNAVAQEAGVTPAQLAMGWVLSRAPHIVPIPGTRSIAHLDENLATATMTFAPETLAAVDAIFTPGAVAGARYAPAMQAQIDTELLPEEVD
ncbi:MAG: aldo/keto reductase [Sphingobium sp.]|uniref:aldo/keto reductase n=1 Tax=Sphingobium sp. CECT 9361 TaxID=2845384 RepID=UPI001E656EC5|nr:aldo/keto reductase [Sphingobium sp. CECT 9361]CAH0353747.1 Aldo-keto reductase IolS [Sphingobium sp. CECT 9361]